MLSSHNKRKKDAIRKRIWDLMLKEGIAKFPLPPHGRIPNFVGAEEAATKLAELDIFKKAKVVKVNPDSPQKLIRYYVLSTGKLLIMPTPRIKKGFLLVNPNEVPRSKYLEAATIKGAFRWGKLVRPWDLPKVDLIVTGSVAVDLWGGRLGKGEGYSEIEYGILRELGKVTDETPVVTTVHDIQVINEKIPRDPWDYTVDLIITPTKEIKTKEKCRPKGILWDLLSPKKLEEIPILQEIKKYLRK